MDHFGVERILNASDWPWGKMQVPIKAIKRACRGDTVDMNRLFYENVAELLTLSV